MPPKAKLIDIKSQDRVRNDKFSDEETKALLRNVKKYYHIVFATLTKENAPKKDVVWKKITEGVNSVSALTREKEKVQKRWSDWLYTIRKNKKKKMSDLDKELQNLLTHKDSDSNEDSGVENKVDEKVSAHLTKAATAPAMPQKNEMQHVTATTTTTAASPRFSDEEKTTLINLMTKHNTILNAPLSSNVTADMKSKLWREITDNVNKVSNNQRNIENIKNKWGKMSSTVKIKCANINRLVRHSSGKNDTQIPTLTQEEEMVATIVGDLAINGVKGGIDIDDDEQSDTLVSEDDDFADVEITGSDPPTNIKHEIEGTSRSNIAKRKGLRGLEKTAMCKGQKRKSETETETLIELEKRKVAIMEEQLEIDKRKMKAIENISDKIDNFISFFGRNPTSIQGQSCSNVSNITTSRSGPLSVQQDDDIYQYSNGLSYTNL